MSDSGLTCIRLNTVTGASQVGLPQQNMGRFAAVGDIDGTITLLKLSKTLHEPQPREKETILEIFEREKKKEEIIKKQRLETEVRRTMLQKERDQGMDMTDPEEEKEELTKLEDAFYFEIENKMKGLQMEHPSSGDEPQQSNSGNGNSTPGLTLNEVISKNNP